MRAADWAGQRLAASECVSEGELVGGTRGTARGPRSANVSRPRPTLRCAVQAPGAHHAAKDQTAVEKIEDMQAHRREAEPETAVPKEESVKRMVEHNEH